jgi:hypothetical protein
MEFHVGEMNSTVRMTDSQSVLNPDVFERLVAAVLQRVRDERAYEERVASERRVRPGASVSEAPSWE